MPLTCPREHASLPTCPVPVGKQDVHVASERGVKGASLLLPSVRGGHTYYSYSLEGLNAPPGQRLRRNPQGKCSRRHKAMIWT